MRKGGGKHQITPKRRHTDSEGAEIDSRQEPERDKMAPLPQFRRSRGLARQKLALKETSD